MGKRLIGGLALGAAALFLGAVPAHAADGISSTTVVTAPFASPTYVEWSAPTYVEWSAPTYVEW